MADPNAIWDDAVLPRARRGRSSTARRSTLVLTRRCARRRRPHQAPLLFPGQPPPGESNHAVVLPHCLRRRGGLRARSPTPTCSTSCTTPALCTSSVPPRRRRRRAHRAGAQGAHVPLGGHDASGSLPLEAAYKVVAARAARHPEQDATAESNGVAAMPPRMPGDLCTSCVQVQLGSQHLFPPAAGTGQWNGPAS
ncbi:hypothetical protein ACP4OV_018526 [Aristida adscensionis]